MSEQLWFTRCPVPTASGLAYNLGWLNDLAEASDATLGILQESGEELSDHHFDHLLRGLVREGGNVPALAARAEGAPTRLIGLTWIDETQAILVRQDSDIASAAQLAGRRIGIPAWAADRARSFPRAMALQGFSQVLRTAGLSFNDVRPVEIATVLRPQVRDGVTPGTGLLGIEALVRGDVDAVYVKGSRSANAAAQAGLRVAVDIDRTTIPAGRVNNGTPRPITVHADLLERRPEIVIGFLAESLRAADWATGNRDGVEKVLARETVSDATGVSAAYGEDYHTRLHPDLSDERVALLDLQKTFLYTHGFLAADFDLRSWVERAPLEQALLRRAAKTPEGIGA